MYSNENSFSKFLCMNRIVLVFLFVLFSGIGPPYAQENTGIILNIKDGSVNDTIILYGKENGIETSKTFVATPSILKLIELTSVDSIQYKWSGSEPIPFKPKVSCTIRRSGLFELSFDGSSKDEGGNADWDYNLRLLDTSWSSNFIINAIDSHQVLLDSITKMCGTIEYLNTENKSLQSEYKSLINCSNEAKGRCDSCWRYLAALPTGKYKVGFTWSALGVLLSIAGGIVLHKSNDRQKEADNKRIGQDYVNSLHLKREADNLRRLSFGCFILGGGMAAGGGLTIGLTNFKFKRIPIPSCNDCSPNNNTSLKRSKN